MAGGGDERSTAAVSFVASNVSLIIISGERRDLESNARKEMFERTHVRCYGQQAWRRRVEVLRDASRQLRTFKPE